MAALSSLSPGMSRFPPLSSRVQHLALCTWRAVGRVGMGGGGFLPACPVSRDKTESRSRLEGGKDSQGTHRIPSSPDPTYSARVPSLPSPEASATARPTFP